MDCLAAAFPLLRRAMTKSRKTGGGRRVARAMILGVCPLFLLRGHDLPIEEILKYFVSEREEMMDFSERLDASVENLLAAPAAE